MELIVRFICGVNLKMSIVCAIIALSSFLTMGDKTVAVIALGLCIYSGIIHILTNIFFNMVNKIIKNT